MLILEYLWIPLVLVVLIGTTVSMRPLFKMVKRLGDEAQQRQRIFAAGHPAQARIVQVRQTGTTVNNQPEVDLLLDVFPSNAPPYRARTSRLVSLFEIPRFQPGATIEVRVDPTDPSRIA